MKISCSEFEESLNSLSFPVAVAVSGGADSLALLYLTHLYAKKRGGGRVIALTVDHGLRPESYEEALWVHKWAQKKGIEHIILKWSGEKPSTRIQEKARVARYRLLLSWCQENVIPTLLLGHHQQDQEETFWLRLASGSGLTGLSGMRKVDFREGIQVLRPLLGFSKDRLQETLKAENLSWLEDPSNLKSCFFRGRLRGLLETEGLTSSRLSKVMEKFQRDSDFIESSVQNVLHKLVKVERGGYLSFPKNPFEALHPALSQRFLGCLMGWYSGSPYPPRSEKIQGILSKLQASSPFTAGGIYWASDQTTVRLFREPSAIQETLILKTLREETLWDQRFWIDPEIKAHCPLEGTLQALGVNPIFEEKPSSRIPTWAWSGLPALLVKGKVVAVPHLCYYNRRGCEKDLSSFFRLKSFFENSLRPKAITS